MRKIPWRKKWQPTPAFLPGEFHGQRSLADCSPLGHTESDTTEATQHAPCILLLNVSQERKSTIFLGGQFLGSASLLVKGSVVYVVAE